MRSFAMQAKDELCEIPVKYNCCKAALLYGLLQYSVISDDGVIILITENENVVSIFERLLSEVLLGESLVSYYGQGYKLEISDSETLFGIYSLYGDLHTFNPDVIKCSNCMKHYFRGAFLSGGTVNSPDSSFHLEIECTNVGALPTDLLRELEISFKYSVRSGRGILYLKDEQSIEYFLHFIEARRAAFSLSDEKIRREIRGNINRQNNFEIANRQKSVNAGSRYVSAVKKLYDSNKIVLLPDDLKATAELRYKNPDLNLSELAAIHDPQITKSGLYHRLSKIVELADEIK